jgi:drug/metabolite transporter (DMT)-like permease
MKGIMEQTQAASKKELSRATFGLIDLMLLVMAIIWGVNFSVVKISLVEMSPLAFNSLRFSLSSALTLGALRLIERDISFAREDWWRLLGLGIIGNTFYQLLFINGIDLTTAGNSSLILATPPIFVSIIGTVSGLERLRKRAWLGIFLSFVGIAAIVFCSGQGLSLVGGTMLGNLLTLGAAACWSVYTVLAKPLMERYSPLRVTTLAMVSGTFFLDLGSIPAWLAQDWAAVSWKGWLGLVFSGSLAIALNYVIWNLGVRKVGGARTAVYSNLVPVIGLITAWLTLGEQILLLQVAGAAVIFVGIYLTRSGRR